MAQWVYTLVAFYRVPQQERGLARLVEAEPAFVVTSYMVQVAWWLGQVPEKSAALAIRLEQLVASSTVC